MWGDKIQNYAGVIPQQTSPDWSSDINQSYMPLLEIEFFEIRFWDLPKPIQYCMYFLTPAPRSCSNLSSPPVAALPLVKSVLIGLKTDPEKIIFICLTWEGSYLLTSSGQMGHGRLYHQIFVKQSAPELSAQLISLSLICFPKSSSQKIVSLLCEIPPEECPERRASKWRLGRLQNCVLWNQEASC